MDVKDYISSGIVESYVLGMATPEERAEFERMCSRYPELVQARTEFELALEEQAMQQAVAPPSSLRQQVLDAVSPVGAKVVPMTAGTPATRPTWLPYFSVAAAVLLLASIFWNVSQYNNNKKLSKDYQKALGDYQAASDKLNDLDQQIAKIINPNMKMAAMKGMPDYAASFATVFWDTTSKDVYLVVNNLPKPASDKQYQLWALLNGKPIDLGMIDNQLFIGEKKLLLHMKNVAGAQAFAITLEKMGGSPTPQGSMYVLGNL